MAHNHTIKGTIQVSHNAMGGGGQIKKKTVLQRCTVTTVQCYKRYDGVGGCQIYVTLEWPLT